MPHRVYVISKDSAAERHFHLPAHMQAAERALELAALLDAKIPGGFEVTPVSLDTQELAARLPELVSQPDTLGAEINIELAREAAALCSGLSSYSLHSGAATAVVRRGQADPRLAARDLLAKGFTAALAACGVEKVRTAMILGTGVAARSALAALHEMGCNRFLVGYRDHERASEISRQLRHWKKQVQFFPLAEMRDFISWAGQTSAFESPYVVEKATDREYRLRAERDDRQDPRRWELVVNATPVGNPGIEPDNLLPDMHFMGCIGRVLEMAGHCEPTALSLMASEAGLHVIGASVLAQALSGEATALWLSEARRREEGLPDEPEHAAQPRKLVLKRRDGRYRGKPRRA